MTRRHRPKVWVTPKTRHTRSRVLVWEIWDPSGRHYIRYGKLEFDVPIVEQLDPHDYVFRAGDT